MWAQMPMLRTCFRSVGTAVVVAMGRSRNFRGFDGSGGPDWLGARWPPSSFSDSPPRRPGRGGSEGPCERCPDCEGSSAVWAEGLARVARELADWQAERCRAGFDPV